MAKARTVAKNLENLTYNFTEDHIDVVEELALELERLYAKYSQRLPSREGIVLCPTSQQSRLYIFVAIKVMKARATLKYSSLPRRKYGRKKLNPALHRFGLKADRKRKEVSIDQPDINL